MCTVSFIARKTGYALAMNRDEQLSRIKGMPPAPVFIKGRTVMCPSEPNGGTWVSVNDAGVAFALINWYSAPAPCSGKTVSRGGVVAAVRALTSRHPISDSLKRLPLKEIGPFRLIGVFPASEEVAQWQWDQNELRCQRHPWQAQQWISSGFDEKSAQKIRGETFSLALKQKSAGTLDWLRRLHRSHGPAAGPFSICMHRAGAATVSCTEIAVTGAKAMMSYYGNAPCRCGTGGAAYPEAQIQCAIRQHQA